MLPKMARSLLFAAASLLTAAAACGGKSLSAPEGLTITRYSSASPIRLTVTMTTCSDRCAQYDPASCAVSVNQGVIELEISVPYGDAEGVDRTDREACSLVCGPPVYAHCDVGMLAAGTYVVRSGAFEKEIVVE